MRYWRLFIFMTLILLLVPPSSAQVPTSVEVVPEKVVEAEFESVDGSAPISLSEHRGGVVVLGLWATWCGPCRMAVGGLSEFNKEFASRGVVVIGLTTEDPKQDAEVVRLFISDSKPELRLGWVPNDAAIALIGGKATIPQILVISGEGVIVTRLMGWSEQSPKLLREAAERALTNPPIRLRSD